jgi:hypothetical protein
LLDARFAAGDTGAKAPHFLLVFLVALIAILPVWMPTFPAMCDAPQIAAQVAIYSQLGNAGFRFSDLFVSHAQTPNLAGYALVYWLCPLMGLVSACKFTVSVALVGFLLASSWLIDELGGDPRMALLAIPGMYGYSFQWGFLSFLMAAPFGVLFVIASLRYFRRPTLVRASGLALLLLLVFFCHALAAAFAAALAGLYALFDLRSPRDLLSRWLPSTLTLAAAGSWWLHSVAGHPVTHKPMAWQIDFDRVPDLFINIAGWPQEWIAAAIVVVLAAPVIALLGVRRSPRYWIPFALCLAVAFFAPHRIFGAESVYERFAMFVLPSLAIALAPAAPNAGRRQAMALAWVLLFCTAWTGGMSWRMNIFEAEARGFSTILDQMQPGQRLLILSCNHNSKAFSAAVFLHYPAWYAALKNGVADPNFAGSNVGLVWYRPDAAPAAQFADFEFHPQLFDWKQHQGERYRYFVVRSSDEMGSKLFAGAGHTVQLRAHDGDWWLYENDLNDPS